MAFCTKCGAELKKGAVFCTQCGARVAPETPIPESQAPKTPAPETPIPESQVPTAREPSSPAPAAPGKKAGASKRTLIIAAIALAVAIAGVAIAAFLVTQMAKSDARDEQTSLWLDYGAQTEQWLADMDDRQERLILTAGEETELDSAQERIRTDLARELDWDSADTPEEAQAAAQEAVETQKQDLERRMDDIDRANEGQVRTLRTQLEGEDLPWAVDSDLTEIETLRADVDAKTSAGDYRGAWEALGQWQDAALRASTAPRGFAVSVAWYDLSDYPTVRVDLGVTDGGGNFVSGLGQDAFYVNERRSVGGSFTRRPVTRVSYQAAVNSISGERSGECYRVEFEVEDGSSFDERFYLDFQVRADDGRGGVVSGCAVEPEDFFKQKYYKFLMAGLDCQTKGERNLLESGVITTNSESYSNHDCLAWQSEETIRTNGPGSDNSGISEELTNYEVLEVRRDGDGYILYGLCELDVSQTKAYDRCREKEKEVIAAQYGQVDENTTFWIEENIYNYEKLTLIRDTDGQWKFHTRVYERPSGSGSAYGINEVYEIYMQ